MIHHLIEIVDELEALTIENNNAHSFDLIGRLYRSLEECLSDSGCGFYNIKETYNDDAFIVSNIESLIDRIKAIMNKLNNV